MSQLEPVGGREATDNQSVFAIIGDDGRIALTIAMGEPIMVDDVLSYDAMAEIRMAPAKYRAWLKAQLHWLEQQSPETTTRARSAVQKRRKR